MRFRAKSLTSLLFAFLLALPMISVISKVIYVQSNKNAYQSYSSKHIYQEIVLTNIDQYDSELTYTISYKQTPTINAPYLTFNYISLTAEDLGIGQATYDTLTRYSFRTSNNKIGLYNSESNTALAYIEWNSNTIFNFKGDLSEYWITNAYVTRTIYTQDSLDNVFEYAVDEVIKENNFGNIDFFSYFTSIFMSDNQVNNRYIGYVNYYLNYALMVSLAYLLFLMLMWFINFARRFLDRGMNYDW